MLHTTRVSEIEAAKLEPSAGHVGLKLEHLYLVWGGYYIDRQSHLETYRDASKLYVYNTHLDKWFCFQTDGQCPLNVTGASAILHGLKMYVVGGHSSNAMAIDPFMIFCLDLRAMKWTQLVPSDFVRPTPRNKMCSWIHNRRLYVFGGYGFYPMHCRDRWPNMEFFSNSADFTEDETLAHGMHWNNQLVCFDFEKLKWSNPTCYGQKPVSRAAHACCLIERDRVVIFGGRHKRERKNDLHILDMNSFTWMKIDSTPGACIPMGRSWHSLSILAPYKVVLYGGFSSNEIPLGDCWVLDTRTWKWTKKFAGNGREDGRNESGRDEKRLWHSATVIDSCLYIYGGCSSNILSTEPNNFTDFRNDFVKLQIEPPPLANLCFSVICDHPQVYKSKKLHLVLPKFATERILAKRGKEIKLPNKSLVDLLEL